MNREDIIRMAQEIAAQYSKAERFQTWTHDYMMQRLMELVAAEREAIAQMIEDAPALMEFAQNDQGGCLMCGFTPKLAAKTIRARGQA